MPTKFRNAEYFKHKNCIDAFIMVTNIITDTGDTAIVNVGWCVQGVFDHWWTGELTRLFIQPDQYDNWVPYEPRGELL